MNPSSAALARRDDSEQISRAKDGVRVLRTLEELEDVRAAWTSWPVHRDAHFDVYKTILNALDEVPEPYVIVVDRGGQPDAMLIGRISKSNLKERVGYVGFTIRGVRVLNFVYGAFVGNLSEENARILLDEVEKALRRGDADVAVLTYVRQDSPLYRFAEKSKHWLMRDHFPSSQPHWTMDVPKAPESFYAVMSGDHRKKIRSEAKKIRAAFPDLQMVRFHGNEGLEQLVKEAEQVASTTYQRGLGVGFADNRPIRDLLSLEAQKGWLRAYVLYANAKPCAFWIGAIYNGAFLSEYLAFDPAFSKYSPGTYLVTQALEEVASQVAIVDFSTGEALYKQRFSNTHWDESTIYLYAPTFVGVRLKAIRTGADITRSTAKKLLEKTSLAGKVKKLWRERAARRAK
jgi:CelD/BcsL family acetyltransferase involved in cellulose biosynthesis